MKPCGQPPGPRGPAPGGNASDAPQYFCHSASRFLLSCAACCAEALLAGAGLGSLKNASSAGFTRQLDAFSNRVASEDLSGLGV